MLDTSSCGSKPLDAETFRVAEELIMLSNRAASASSMDEKSNDSPSNISGFFDYQDIINSRCDLSQSELLKEHRVRFRRVRRRWNIEQRTKKKEYLARFHVQGIPLVQHLEALTHWR
ncbi:uncharacterized protein PITG_02848 [Phytophthora infestans T30-4]|uniref:Uncharacterized protein n=1 Tax=Phytophthora infestans (strain T30-4) TaxID=403677 RepID=D0MXD2_PHYIT|nr:uncharacterized protein PITG_02848 [Phytophthora infestans T30-4]EEY64295.1 conserved hypothetical protein [Phytophthora infestans T30-4]|eukprot:XP_002907731.1 conserved hypothetical protein [Phytophthora infestans T30-4]